MADTILVESCTNGLGVITINKPKALNASDIEMVSAIREALAKWKTDETVQAVLLKGNGGKAFCSGGDVKGLREALIADPTSQIPKEQVFQEYNLIYEARTFEKPIVAFLEGVTMGFGLGLSSAAKFGVATDRTRLAMPENNIGLFPDVGFSYLAANCLPAGIGRLLAITGGHLIGPDDALKSGLATHFVPTASLSELTATLRTADLLAGAEAKIAACIEGFVAQPPEPGKLHCNSPLITRFASAETLQDAICALQEETSSSGSWAAELKAEHISRGSPFSQAVIWQLLKAAEAERELLEPARLASALERDFATASRVLYRYDFCEGVRAVLVDKMSTPAWQPAGAGDISEEDITLVTNALPEGERRLGLTA